MNERSEVWIDRGNGETVVARQVVGILARRVVCRARVGEKVHAGTALRHHEVRLADGRVPAAAGGAAVAVGQMVRGGETVIAVLD